MKFFYSFIKLPVVFKKLCSYLKLFNYYLYDFVRFIRFSGMSQRRSRRESYAAWLTMYYHRLEKGLSLKEPRLRFGEDVVRVCCSGLKDYINRFGADREASLCWHALKDYFEFHKKNDALNPKLFETFNSIPFDPIEGSTSSFTAYRSMNREAVLIDSAIDFHKFALSRCSIRDFSSEKVSLVLIRKAAVIASKTPSVCNRQAWRLHIYQGKDLVAKVLACQGGNRGFTECIGTVLVVTATSQHFFSPVERNQGFIDGGLYSMSLVYALHSLGLGTCCLNLSLSPGQDKLLKQVAGIGIGEMPIMMIAVGHYPDHFKVASSERRDLSKTLVVH